MRAVLKGRLVSLNPDKTKNGKEYHVASILQEFKGNQGQMHSDLVRARIWNGAVATMKVGEPVSVEGAVRAYVPRPGADPIVTFDVF